MHIEGAKGIDITIVDVEPKVKAKPEIKDNIEKTEEVIELKKE